MERDGSRSRRFRRHRGAIYGFLTPRNSLYSAGCLEHKVVEYVIQYACLLFAISFHESAHAWAAFKFGDTTAKDLGRITLNPIHHIDPIGTVILPILGMVSGGTFMIGWAKPTPVNLSRTPNPRKANLVVSAAGPVSNFILCTAGVLVLVVIRRLTVGPATTQSLLEPLWAITLTFTFMNFVLGIFNLIPLPPLDGSHVLAAIAGGRVAEVLEHSSPMLGFGLILVLSYLGVLRAILAPFYGIFSRILNTLLA
jgi:Zn-dependent protease